MKQEDCERCKMYRQALLDAVKICMILLKQTQDGKMPQTAIELFEAIHFTLLELDGEKFAKA